MKFSSCDAGRGTGRRWWTAAAALGCGLILLLAERIEGLRTARADGGAGEAPTPASFEGRGRLVDLAEEMQRLYQAKVPVVHEPIWGFRLDMPESPTALVYYVLLRTPISEALFADKRFRERTLELAGRVFPGSTLLEVSRYRWLRDGKLYDVYYWCETCSIRGHDPKTCACCQEPVELRESLVSEEPKKQ
jgi:hypothetical protein